MTRSTAFRVVEDFEGALGEYTGAPHVVTVDSCTNAIFLALLYCRTFGYGEPLSWPSNVSKARRWYVCLPTRTYVGVAQAAINAGYRIRWMDEDSEPFGKWSGWYGLLPTPVVDAAKRFTSGMYSRWPNRLACVSFQAGKHLPIGRGGAILTDSAEAAAWLRRARFDGRTPGDDAAPIQVPGWHMYLTPPDAARGLWLLSWAAKDNPDLPCDEYQDLSEMEAFK